MHNKAWIADGRVAVLGGRNIGQEYFDASTDTNFRDLDVVLFGQKVVQASATFDEFWNSEAALPISALSKASPAQLANAVARVTAEAQEDSANRHYRRTDPSETLRAYFRGELPPTCGRSIKGPPDPP